MVGIDNRCSGCITHVRSDIPGELRECRRIIKGFGGERHFRVWTGTIHWSWEDDDGRSHDFVIPNGFYIPDGKVRLLSPQHFGQSQRGSDRRGGAGETTTGLQTVLFWGNRQYKRTIPIDRHSSNVATFRLSAGYKKFHAYCVEAGLDDPQASDSNPLLQDNVINVDDTALVSDDEDDGEPEVEASDQSGFPTSGLDGDESDEQQDSQTPLHIDDPDDPIQDAPTVVIDEEDREAETATAELLKLHYCFGHLPFSKLRVMADRGILPKRIGTCNVPVCSACQYAKATKRAWRPRTAKNYKPEKAVNPGDVVSVDQLVSPSPGLIAQVTGFLTKKRYRYATVYVDQASGLGFVYLQKEATVEETLESKAAWERYAISHGVVTHAYHADNGIFKANGWVQACRQKEQNLTFAAVGAHHTNGKAERRIRELQEMARTMLIHANRRWPDAINANLWPYAVRHANDCINAAPNMQDPLRRSPLQLFTKSNVDINKKHYIPFGCPIFVLKEPLQKGQKIHKWKARANVGIYLGQSPIHNKNVALVLNRFTGHVSPQFHFAMDPGFYSLKQENLVSFWQAKTYFTDASKPGKPTKKRTRGKEGADASKRHPRNSESTNSEGVTTNAQPFPEDHGNVPDKDGVSHDFHASMPTTTTRQPQGETAEPTSATWSRPADGRRSCQSRH